MTMRIRIQESQISADPVLYPEQSINQKMYFEKSLFYAGICASEGQGLRSGNAGPDPGEPNQCGSSSVSGTIYKPKNIC
jgi:hypothetical protein